MGARVAKLYTCTSIGNHQLSIMKPVVIFRKIKLQGVYRIGFSFNASILNRRARLIGARWTSVHQCWQLSYTRDSYQLLKKTFGDCTLQVKQSQDPAARPKQAVLGPLTGNKTAGSRKPLYSENNQAELQRFKALLIVKGYAAGSQRTYKNEFGIFLRQIKKVAVQDMTAGRLDAYFDYCRKQLSLSQNSIQSRFNALKFYYEQVLGKKGFMRDLPATSGLPIPRVPSEEKILKRLQLIANCKHKALLTVACTAGLKVNEVVQLKISDVHSDRMQLFIATAGAKTGRWETLSAFTLELLRAYFLQYRPQHWLFEGPTPGCCYSIRSTQQLFRQAYKLTGMPKNLGFYDLHRAARISENGFCTGVDHQAIHQHNSTKSSRPNKKSLQVVESPLDTIARKNNL